MSYRGGGGAVTPWSAGEQGREPLQKGSVRAARERMQERTQHPERAQWGQRQQEVEPLDSPPPSRGNPLASQYSAANSPGRPRPRQVPEGPHVYPPDQHSLLQQQWPLHFGPPPDSAQPQSSSTSRNFAAPQRPQRALGQATFFDSSRDTMSPGALQPPQPAYWQDDNYLSPSYGSPNTTRPLTDSSFASDATSIGSIPDFPVPSAQVPSSRRSQPYVGPPPSARRGPSSYYSQMSYVSPIAEESSEARGSVGSFASSNVFPSDMPGFYLQDASEDDATTPRPGPHRQDPRDDNDACGLVRKASLGKRTKPIITTIKSGEALRPALSAGAQSSIQRQASTNSRGVTSPLGSGSVLLDASSSSEESLQRPAVRSKNASSESLKAKARSSYDIMTGTQPTSPIPAVHAPSNRKAPTSPLVPADSRIEHILSGLEKGGALAPGGPPEREARKGTLADRVGARRPARLNVDAVRDAEARGSLTSLPDLIRRATRLAANLDRGKTASRLGFEWLETGGYEKQLSPDMRDPNNKQKGRRSTTLSGMLSAFPPPGVASPHSPRTQWPMSNGSSAKSLNPGRRHNSSGDSTNRRRRYCGLSLCAFIMLVLFLVSLVAAAIVIPVVLIALPKGSAAPTDSATANAKEACQKKMPCENGGGSVAMADGSCGCLCTNGFTGPRCQNPSDVGCTTKAIAGVKDASMGSSIPPLMEVANDKYSIPLDGEALLSLFAATNMTCGAENALVTLTGSSSSKRSEVVLEDPLPDHVLRSRLRARAQPSASSAATTSNGIVVAGTKPTQTYAVAATQASTVAIATGSSAPGTNSTSKDFAKVGVLFVLQESKQINVAIKAQEQLSKYMNTATQQGSTMTDAHNVTLGSGYFIDLWYWTVTLANGTVYGNGFNGSATVMPATT